MNDGLDLSRTLTSIVAAVEGVGDIYPSGSFAQAATLTVVNAISDEQTDDAKVAVSSDGSGQLKITVTIGVAFGHSARETLKAVSDTLRAYLETEVPATQAPSIDVKVSRIETESSIV